MRSFVVHSVDVGDAMNGQVLIDTERFDDDLGMLTDEFGFRVESIWPADAPSTAVLSGHGITLRLVATHAANPATLMLVTSRSDDDRIGVHHLPGGSRLIVEPAAQGYTLPPAAPELSITTTDGGSAPGRAGMQYRDLLPGRWGGRFITSLISIPDGGPVPDYVHFHRVRFQLIFVKSGWVRVVYEDQGEPFMMRAGDAVLQVPEIRHRVLEASPGLEVIEITSPAEHMTVADPNLDLPNGVGDPSRRWDGQAFVHHVATDACYRSWDGTDWECRDTGIEEATNGIASVRVARPGSTTAGAPASVAGEGEFRQLVVVTGAVSMECLGQQQRLLDGSSAAIPPGASCALTDATADCELLDVTVFPPV